MDMTSAKQVLYIRPKDYAKLLFVATRSISPRSEPHEIGGYGFYDPDKKELYDFFIVKQKVTGSSVDFDHADVAQKQALITRKKNLQLRVWWHTHGSHGASPSPTDIDEIKLLGQAWDYVISIIVNIRGEVYARVDYFTPCYYSAEVELRPRIILSSSEKETIDGEIAENVTFEEPKIYGPNYVYGSGEDVEYFRSQLDNPGFSLVPPKLPYLTKPQDNIHGILDGSKLEHLIRQEWPRRRKRLVRRMIYGRDPALMHKKDFWEAILESNELEALRGLEPSDQFTIKRAMLFDKLEFDEAMLKHATLKLPFESDDRDRNDIVD